MFGFSTTEITGALIGLAVLWLFLSSRRPAGTNIVGPLVLRRFDLNESPRSGVFLRIVGRPAGLLAWLMTVLRIEAETTLEVTREHILIKFASLFGEGRNLAPLAAIASTHCSYYRPLWLLVFGGITVLVGVLAAFQSQEGMIVLVGLLVGLVLLLAFWLSRKLRIWVETSGGMPMGLIFKPSVIEGVSVDMNRAVQAMALVEKKVLESQGAVTPGGFPGAPSPSAPRCTKCGAELTSADTFCGSCGAPAKQARAAVS